jgi:hypothetical protein
MLPRRHRDEKMRFRSRVIVRHEERERRSGLERRRFSYDAHIPERRGQLDRRNGSGRESFDSYSNGGHQYEERLGRTT